MQKNSNPLPQKISRYAPVQCLENFQGRCVNFFNKKSLENQRNLLEDPIHPLQMCLNHQSLG